MSYLVLRNTFLLAKFSISQGYRPPQLASAGSSGHSQLPVDLNKNNKLYLQAVDVLASFDIKRLYPLTAWSSFPMQGSLGYTV